LQAKEAGEKWWGGEKRGWRWENQEIGSQIGQKTRNSSGPRRGDRGGDLVRAIKNAIQIIKKKERKREKRKRWDH